MKNNFLLLTKVSIKASFDTRSFKQNKGKMISFMVYLGLIFFFIMLSSAFLSVIFGLALKESNESLIHTTIYMGVMCSFLNLSTSIMTLKNVYAGKDYEMLQAMPIKKRDIVASKIVSLYITEMLYALALLLPNAIVNAIMGNSFAEFLIPFVLIFFVPALPIFVAGIITFILSAISDRFRFANIITMVLYAGMFALIFIFSYRSNTSKGDIAGMTGGLMWINPTLYFAQQAALDNLIYLLIFVGINLGLLIILVIVLALSYDYIHELVSSFRSSIKYERKELKNKSEFKALVQNQFKMISKSKLIFINSILSGLMGVIFAGIGVYTVRGLLDKPEVADAVYKYAYVGAVAIMFAMGMSVPSCYLISVEGKYFWMIKSYPIDYKNYVKSKLITSLIFTLPFSLIAATIIVIFIRTTAYNIIMIYLLTIAYTLFINVLGLRMNLAFPKLKWMNENEVVKNSASAVLTMLIDLSVVMVMSGMLIGFTFLNIYLATILALVTLLIPTCILYLTSITKAERIINSYENF